jgi:hypothetical protein
VFILYCHRQQDFVFSVQIVTNTLLEPVVNDLTHHDFLQVLIPPYAPHSLTILSSVLYILDTYQRIILNKKTVAENISVMEALITHYCI